LHSSEEKGVLRGDVVNLATAKWHPLGLVVGEATFATESSLWSTTTTEKWASDNFTRVGKTHAEARLAWVVVHLM
jgi:hypothetical protein